MHLIWNYTVASIIPRFHAQQLQVLADEDGSDSDSDSDNDAETDKRKVKDITKGMEMKKITRAKEKVQVSRKDTKEALLHHNPLHPELALKVLGQICNGQNRVMQVVFLSLILCTYCTYFCIHICFTLYGIAIILFS